MTPGLHRILVVDDETSILRLTKTILERSGYAVETTQSPREAFKLMENNLFDLIITDAIMPNMSGYDFVASIRANPLFETTPVVMLTRKRDRQDVQKAVLAGVNDYVVKPIDEALLLDKVALALNRRDGHKRNTFELHMFGNGFNATIGMPCQISRISETDLSLSLPYPLRADDEFRVTSPIFRDIGIDAPLLKFVDCVQKPDLSPPYEIRMAFVGLAETDLKKIRSWLQKEALKRKK